MLANTLFPICALLVALSPVSALGNFNLKVGAPLSIDITDRNGRTGMPSHIDSGGVAVTSNTDFTADPITFKVFREGKEWSTCTVAGNQEKDQDFVFSSKAGKMVLLEHCGPHSGVTITCTPKVACPSDL